MIAKVESRLEKISEDLISFREKEVLQLICAGHTVKEIASILYISQHTVISHKKNMIQKLQAKNCVHLVVMGIKNGIVSL